MAEVLGCSDIENVSKGKVEDEIEGPPSKRMKQARLPFKPLEQKPQIVSPQSTKKRKLSDAESPSAKLLKNHKPERQPSGDKLTVVDNDPEVSSSSEAENVQASVQNRVRNALERFVCKRSQDEISSTNESIDVTDKNNVEVVTIDDDDDEKPDEKAKEIIVADSSLETVENLEQKSADPTNTEDTAMEEDQSAEIVVADSSVNDNACKNSNSENQTSDKEDIPEKENVETNIPSPANSDKEGKVEDDKKSTVVPKTPTCGKAPSSSITTPVSQSPGDSASDSTTTTPKSSKKTSTRPKISEQKRKERDAQREKIKQEKERILQEKKKQKELEQQEKERLREEKKREKEEEKAEKEKQKREEKEKREKERLEKLQVKEEEKKKKQEQIEAKMEEKRKKEEEIKLKKEEKQREEDEKMKKQQKTKQVFQSFFKKTSPVSKPSKTPEGMFMPFEVKKDMFMAPSHHRENLDEDAITTFDKHFSEQVCNNLYLEELKNGDHKPRKLSPKNKKIDEEDDVLLVHDEETVKKVTYHCKLMQFHKNYRPPYYGTWRKKSRVLTPRNPWKQDSDLFDYEVDSDDEWEEEEPGESLSASEGEDEKEEEKDEEDEDGWMVPHGYLSEDEVCDDDEEVTPELIKMRQTARAEAWESEQKRQTKPALPVIIGCVWEQGLQNIQKQLVNTLQSYKAVCLTANPIQTTHSGAGVSSKLDSPQTDKSSTNTPKTGLRKPVPEEAMPDLIKLVHGNLAGIKKLIKEFRLFWKQKMSGDLTSPADISMEVEEPDSTEKMETDCKPVTLETDETVNDEDSYTISKRQIELKIGAIAVREKRPAFKKFCWYVHEKLLDQFGLQDLPVPSMWEFISQPQKPKLDDSFTSPAGRKTPTVSITQFARPMSPSQIAAQHKAVALKQAKEAAEAKRLAEAKQVALLAEKQAQIAAAEKQAQLAAEMQIAANKSATSIQSDQKSISAFIKTQASSPRIKCPLSVKPIAVPSQSGPSVFSPPLIKPQPVTASTSKFVASQTGKPIGSPSPAQAQKRRIAPTMISLLPNSKPVAGGNKALPDGNKNVKPATSSVGKTTASSCQIQTTAVIEIIPHSAKIEQKPPVLVHSCPKTLKVEELKQIQCGGDNSCDAIVID